VCRCPPELVPGYYWYGSKQHSLGCIPNWVQELQTQETINEENTSSHVVHSPATTDDIDVPHQFPDDSTGATDDFDDSCQSTNGPGLVNIETCEEPCDDSLYDSIASHAHEESMSTASNSAIGHTPSLTGADGTTGNQHVKFRDNRDLDQ